MTTLITGAAGFIGSHFSKVLLDLGTEVIGIDNLNDYYDPSLKHLRLKELEGETGFSFHHVDLADLDALTELTKGKKITNVVHLAAQAGVRYSLENPHAYVQSNLVGHVNILELCRHMDGLDHLMAASSSSVYGGNKKIPFSETDPVDKPVSLYAATKKADELLSHSYSHLYGIPQTMLRFFTVYGPKGRPDMAYWSFSENILEGKPIRVFNNGDMRRDFTFIDDVTDGMRRIWEKGNLKDADGLPYQIYNIGNNQPEPLLRMIEVLEEALGQKAEKIFEPMQDGDVKETYADISAIERDYGYNPSTSIEQGLSKFVSWYRDYRDNN